MPDATLAREVAAAIRALADGNAANQTDLANGGALTSLIAQLGDPGRAASHAIIAGAICSLAEGHAPNQAAVAAERSGLLRLIEMISVGDGLRPEATAVSALSALAELPANRRVLAEMGAIPKLVALLSLAGEGRCAEGGAEGDAEEGGAKGGAADDAEEKEDAEEREGAEGRSGGGSGGGGVIVPAKRALLRLVEGEPANQLAASQGLVEVLSGKNPAGSTTSGGAAGGGRTGAVSHALAAQMHATELLAAFALQADTRRAFLSVQPSAVPLLVRQVCTQRATPSNAKRRHAKQRHATPRHAKQRHASRTSCAHTRTRPMPRVTSPADPSCFASLRLAAPRGAAQRAGHGGACPLRRRASRG